MTNFPPIQVATAHPEPISTDRPQVYFQALGCRLNEAELEGWATDFGAIGYAVTNDSERADLIVVNSCAVTGEAARKSRQLVRRFNRINPSAKLIVSGCYASLEPDKAAMLDGVDLVIDNQDKDRLVELAQERLDLIAMPEAATAPGVSTLFKRGRNRAFIKIQDGCRHRCSYCIVTTARGEERSRSTRDIIDQINRLHADNIKEVVLTGVHIGGYGSDTGSNLAELIQDILDHTDIPRLRLGSVEPWDLGDNFFSLFTNQRLMPHLHLPLQSGSDTVLRRMARRCKTQEFRDLVTTARDTVPDFNVTTDIIVGFPGETDSEWQEGLQYIEALKFSHIHIFSYSAREGTGAARMGDQISATTKRARSRELHDLAGRLKQEVFESSIGKTTAILWEGDETSTSATTKERFGYTANFLRARIDGATVDCLSNSIRRATLSGLSNDGQTLIAQLQED